MLKNIRGINNCGYVIKYLTKRQVKLAIKFFKHFILKFEIEFYNQQKDVF